METGFTRNKLLSALREQISAPFMVGLDQSHASKIVIRDLSDRSNGARWGRWVVQVFRAVPMRGTTVWHNPALVLRDTGGEQWIAAVGDQPEVTGFLEVSDLADYVASQLDRDLSRS